MLNGRPYIVKLLLKHCLVWYHWFCWFVNFSFDKMIFSIFKVYRNRERRTASVRHFPLCDMLLVLQSEIPSGICAKLRTVATSNNRDHPIRSLWSSPFASTINCSPGSQALLRVTHQDHSIGITLLLLVRATYIYFCSSRTSRSWWIIQSTQHQRRGCNIRKVIFL